MAYERNDMSGQIYEALYEHVLPPQLTRVIVELQIGDWLIYIKSHVLKDNLICVTSEMQLEGLLRIFLLHTAGRGNSRTAVQVQVT